MDDQGLSMRLIGIARSGKNDLNHQERKVLMEAAQRLRMYGAVAVPLPRGWKPAPYDPEREAD